MRSCSSEAPPHLLLKMDLLFTSMHMQNRRCNKRQGKVCNQVHDIQHQDGVLVKKPTVHAQSGNCSWKTSAACFVRLEAGRHVKAEPEDARAGARNAIKDLVGSTDGCHSSNLPGHTQVIHKQWADALAEQGDEQARA